ncbi:MAG TPA: vitamin K epoxide reductase family protein [Gaiellaceae bacterium]|nr:vitamin K epoxide reductase family protein [Gaiellaceae bacterium]
MTDRRLRAAVGALALAGLAVAAYLTYLHYAGGAPYCVAGGSDCEKVQESEYAELAGVPVALLGMVAYAALLATAIVPGQAAAAVGAGIALAGTAFSAWLLYAQLALIEAVCQWCVANDIVIALAAVASVFRLRQST